MQKYILYFFFFIPFLSFSQNTDSAESRLNTVEIIGIIPDKFHTPGSTFSIRKSQIRFSNSATSADLLMESGKVFVQKSQAGGGSPVLRGFEANKVLIVVDGVRLNNLIFRGGHLQNVLRMDNFAMQKVSVILGPQALNYGSDALGGVMSFETEKPVFLEAESDKKLQVSGTGLFRYGSAANERTQHYSLRFSGKKWGAFSSVSFSSFGDLKQGKAKNPFNSRYPNLFDRNVYVQNVEGKDSVFTNLRPEKQIYTGYSQLNFMQKFSAQTGSLLHEVGFYLSGTSNVPRYDRLTEMSNGLPRFAEWNYGPEKWGMLNYGLTFQKACKLYDVLTTRLAVQHFEESRISRRFNSTNRKHQVEKVNALNFNVNAKKIAGKHFIEYGLEGIYNSLNSNAFSENIKTQVSSPADTRYPDGENNLKSVSVFLSDNYNIGTKVLLSGGLRYNYNSLYSEFKDTTFFNFPFKEAKQENGAWSGKLAATYQGNSWKLMVAGSTAYRIPNVDDMSKVFESAGGNLIVPNAELKPEYAQTGEIQVGSSSDQAIQFSIGGYLTRLTNAIQLGATTYEGKDSVLYDGTMSAVLSNQNAFKARILGGYAGVSAHFAGRFSAYGNITFTRGRIATDSTPAPLDHIPPLFGNLGIKYAHGKWNAQFYTLLNGAKKLKEYNLNGEDNFQYATPEGMPAWFTLNVKASCELNPHVTFMGGIENILDTNYRVFASGVSGAGRNIYVALSGRF